MLFWAAGAFAASCLDPYEELLIHGYVSHLDGRRESAHFDLAYDTTDPVMDEATIGDVLTALEHAWTVEVDELGWPRPLGSEEGGQVLVMVWPMPAGAPAGLSTSGLCGEERHGWMTIDDHWFTSSRGYIGDLTSHELGHLVQRPLQTWGADTKNLWFAEASAVWIEDAVNPDTNLYIKDFVPTYLRDPQLGLESFENGVDYGHALWPIHLADRLGNDVIREIWSGEGDALARTDTIVGLDPQFADFLARTAAFDYPDGALYADWNRTLELSEGSGMFTDGGLDGEGVGAEPYGGEFVRVAIEPLEAGESVRLVIQAEGDVAVGLYAGDQAFAAGTGEIVLDAGTEGAGEVRFGVGPTGEWAPWSWAIERIEPPEPEPQGCACESAPAPGSLAWPGGALAALAWRRRSRGGRIARRGVSNRQSCHSGGTNAITDALVALWRAPATRPSRL